MLTAINLLLILYSENHSAVYETSSCGAFTSSSGLEGVLAGAIDYYILDKFQRITKTKPYDEVKSSPSSASCLILPQTCIGLLGFDYYQKYGALIAKAVPF